MPLRTMIRRLPALLLTAALLLSASGVAAKDEPPSISLALPATQDGTLRTGLPYLWLDGESKNATSIELRIDGTSLRATPTRSFAGGACLWRIEGPALSGPEAKQFATELLRVLGPRIQQDVEISYPWVRLRTNPSGWIDTLRVLHAPRVSVEFRVEVRPDEVLRRHAKDNGDPLPRLGLWKGDAKGFKIFKRVELLRWKEARDTKTAYVPSRAGYRLVRKRDARTEALDDFAVVEIGEGWFPDHRILSYPLVGQSETGHPVVNFSVRNEDQNRFRAFTTRNVGLPLAILVDGELLSAPRINAPMDKNVQISLGVGKREERERDAKRLVTGLQSAGIAGPGLTFVAALRVDPRGRFELILPTTKRHVVVMAVRDAHAAQASFGIQPEKAAKDPDDLRLRAVVLASELQLDAEEPAVGSASAPSVAAAKATLDRMRTPELARSTLRHLARQAMPESDWVEVVLYAAQQEEPSVHRATGRAAEVRPLPASTFAKLATLVRKGPVPGAESLARAITLGPLADATALAQDEHPRIRVLAVWVLARHHTKEAFDLLVGLAGDEDAAVTKAALDCLISRSAANPSRKGEVIDLVVQSMARKVSPSYLVMTLTQLMGAEFLVTYIGKRLETNPEAMESYCALLVQLMFNDPATRRPLSAAADAALRTALTRGEANRVRIAAILRFANGGDREALDVLFEVANGRDHQLAKGAVMALGFGSTGQALPEGPEATTRAHALLHSLTKQEGTLGDYSACALVKLGATDDEARARVTTIANDKTHPLTLLAQQVLKGGP